MSTKNLAHSDFVLKQLSRIIGFLGVEENEIGIILITNTLRAT